jgi:hypothetical protein
MSKRNFFRRESRSARSGDVDQQIELLPLLRVVRCLPLACHYPSWKLSFGNRFAENSLVKIVDIDQVRRDRLQTLSNRITFRSIADVEF